MRRAKRGGLTDLEWEKVFRARCKSKQGQTLSDDERALVVAAYSEDRERYSNMDRDVFNATVPFGSSAVARQISPSLGDRAKK